jgi:hypothetical protein
MSYYKSMAGEVEVIREAEAAEGAAPHIFQ